MQHTTQNRHNKQNKQNKQNRPPNKPAINYSNQNFNPNSNQLLQTLWYCLLLSDKVLCCLVLSCTASYCFLPTCTVSYSHQLSRTLGYCFVLSGTVSYCPVLSGTVSYLYCTVRSRTVLYCLVLCFYCRVQLSSAVSYCHPTKQYSTLPHYEKHGLEHAVPGTHGRRHCTATTDELGTDDRSICSPLVHSPEESSSPRYLPRTDQNPSKKVPHRCKTIATLSP